MRCGSLASSGRPVAVRDPAITQLLLPPARAVTSSHSRPGGRAGESRTAAASGRSEGTDVEAGPSSVPRLDNRRGARGQRPHQRVGGRRANCAAQQTPDQLAAAILGKPPRHQARDRQRVDRRPGFGRQPQELKFRGAAPAAHAAIRRIHAVGVPLSAVRTDRCGSLPLCRGSSPQSQRQESLVGADRGRTEDSDKPSARRPPVDLHLPRPFAARGDSRPPSRRRRDRGHKGAVSPKRSKRISTALSGRAGQLAVERRHGATEQQPQRRDGQRQGSERQ